MIDVDVLALIRDRDHWRETAEHRERDYRTLHRALVKAEDQRDIARGRSSEHARELGDLRAELAATKMHAARDYEALRSELETAYRHRAELQEACRRHTEAREEQAARIAELLTRPRTIQVPPSCSCALCAPVRIRP